MTYFNGVFDNMEEHVHGFSVHLNHVDCLQTALKIGKVILEIVLASWPRDILETANKRLNSKPFINLIYMALSSADHENKALRVLTEGPLSFLLAIALEI